MKKATAVVLIAAVVLSCLAVLSGCGGQEAASGGGGDINFESYPLEGDYKLTYFLSPNAAVLSKFENLGETEFAKELEKRTGIQIEYIHPAAGQGDQALSLAIASGEMADIIELDWSTYQGGPAKTISDGTIIPLNDLMGHYTPNLNQFLAEKPDIDRMIKTDDGQYYAFPFIRDGELLLRSTGMMVRRDWLEELGLEIPTTIPEMENVLRAFKNEKGIEIPITCKSDGIEGLLNIFGATNGFYLEDGVVTYGPTTERYREAMTTLNRWYEEGLLDGNFIANDSAAVNANVLNDKVGMVYAGGGGDLGTWLDSTENPNFDMVGIPDMLMEDGSVGYAAVATQYPGFSSVAITTACDNPALAAIFLDYAYGEEGTMLYNYGIEGVSYEMVDGVPQYTDMIYNNPDGFTMAEAMANYFRASSSGPFPQQENYIKGFYYRDQQRESLDNWLKNYDVVKDMVMPKVSRTEEEADEYSDVMNEVEKYVAKMRSEFIIGSTDISQFDSYLAELENLGINSVIESTKNALERYNAR